MNIDLVASKYHWTSLYAIKVNINIYIHDSKSNLFSSILYIQCILVYAWIFLIYTNAASCVLNLGWQSWILPIINKWCHKKIHKNCLWLQYGPRQALTRFLGKAYNSSDFSWIGFVALDERLTGLPLQVRDRCISLYNQVQDWNSLHAQSLEIVTKIVNMKLKVE